MHYVITEIFLLSGWYSLSWATPVLVYEDIIESRLKDAGFILVVIIIC